MGESIFVMFTFLIAISGTLFEFIESLKSRSKRSVKEMRNIEVVLMSLCRRSDLEQANNEGNN